MCIALISGRVTSVKLSVGLWIPMKCYPPPRDNCTDQNKQTTSPQRTTLLPFYCFNVFYSIFYVLIIWHFVIFSFLGEVNKLCLVIKLLNHYLNPLTTFSTITVKPACCTLAHCTPVHNFAHL